MQRNKNSHQIVKASEILTKYKDILYAWSQTCRKNYPLTYCDFGLLMCRAMRCVKDKNVNQRCNELETPDETKTALLSFRRPLRIRIRQSEDVACCCGLHHLCVTGLDRNINDAFALFLQTHLHISFVRVLTLQHWPLTAAELLQINGRVSACIGIILETCIATGIAQHNILWVCKMTTEA